MTHISQPSTERIPLNEWIEKNDPDTGLIWSESARDQFCFVHSKLAYVIWNSLLEPGVPLEERQANLTVDGTHRSKSVLLPVYRFDCAGESIKLRGNFYDWCVRCSVEMTQPFLGWMRVQPSDKGYFEGMEIPSHELPTSFVVHDQYKLFAAIWWMLNEAR